MNPDLAAFLDTPAAWLHDPGPATDVVLSTRARLARNLGEFPFPHQASGAVLDTVWGQVDRQFVPHEALTGAKVLRLAMVMALELGDSRLVTDIREMIEERFASDLEMIAFQRDKLGGQVFGAPFCGTFERSDGKTLRFPMDGLGRSTMFLFWSKENH